MWALWVSVLGAVLISQTHGQAETKVVRIAQGLVRGYKDPGLDVYTFYDIPYATASRRYQAPDPPPTWGGTFDALRRGVACPQGISLVAQDTHVFLEDCLVAHVFVPNTTDTNLPVMVSIHGGAFQHGWGELDSFKTLAQDQNIISVSFNYRLGVLGFLCLGTKEAPGNAGLKDQLALLRWVKQNIASFGGNPDDVTIRGCSAGSVMVDILTLSKTAYGLFNKAISESGAHLGSISVQPDPIENAKTIGEFFNVTNVDDLTALQEFYINAPVELLTSRTYSGNRHSGVYFSPCVEKDLGEEVILLEAPYNILKSGEYVRYPMVYGFTDLEGTERMMFYDTWMNDMNNDFTLFLPQNLQFENLEERTRVANEIKEFYFGTDVINQTHILSFIDYFSDVLFAHPMMRSVKMNAEAGDFNFYLYKYSFYDNNTVPIPHTDVRGAAHCKQFIAVADEDETIITEEYRTMKRIMRELWGNFVRTGVPVPANSTLPTWPPTDGNRTSYMSLGTTVTLGDTPIEQRTLFWDSIYEKYYRIPIPPTRDSASVIKSVYLMYVLMVAFLLS